MGLRKICMIWMVVMIVTAAGCSGGSAFSSAPAKRYAAGMVFVPAEGKAYLFGGRYEGIFGTAYRNDLWRYDYARREWEGIQAQFRPMKRGNFGMVYDPDHHQIILFGGYAGQRLGDTWIYDMAKSQWQEVTPAISPPPRSDPGMVYDETHHVTILFSGYGLDEQRDIYDDTWAFDSETNTRTEMHPEPSPPIMYGQTMIYDSLNQQVLLWGGHEAVYRGGETISHRYGNEIWRYDYLEDAWDMLAYSNRPTARYWHGAVFDPLHSRLLIFGGHIASGHTDDAWYASLPGDRWQEVTSDEKPSARENPAMCYDTTNNVIILFGGLEEDFDDLGDTWALVADGSGEKWIKLDP